MRIAILLALLIYCVPVACQPRAPRTIPLEGRPAPTVTVPSDLPTVVALAGRFEPEGLAVLDEQVAVFEATQADTWVEIVRLDKQADRRQKQIAARLGKEDSTVDMYVLDPTWPARFATGGGLAALDRLLKFEGVATDTFLPGAIEASTVNGELLALPLTADGGFLYYRRDLLDKYGYEPPRSWTDLQQIALEIQEREQLPEGFVWPGIAAEDLTCVTLEFVWSFGGDVLDSAGQVAFDSPQTRAALQQMVDLVETGASPQDVNLYDDTRALNAFRDQGAVFMRGWYSAWESLNDASSPVAGKVGLAPLPASCLGGQGIALSSFSLYPDKALHLMASLAAYEPQVQMALAVSQPPALDSAYQDSRVLASAPILQDVRAGLAVGRARPSVPEYTQVSEAIYSQVHAMLSGELQVDDTAGQIQALLEAILEQ